MKIKCGECRFYHPENGYTGRCRRYPPTEIKDVTFDSLEESYREHWPTVHPNVWCGEFKRKVSEDD